MPFFTYRQNNSGGQWDFDAKAGISHLVIVEADDAKHADYLAECIGLYFDGSGDCPCCGYRWNSQWHDEEGTDVPMSYSFEIGPDKPYKSTLLWMAPNPEAFIHYKDKSIVPVMGEKISYEEERAMWDAKK